VEYRRFGNLGFEVSRLSFGASALGGVFRAVDEGDAIRAVHAALDAGINYLDVAPAYGATRSETVLGKALRGVSRDRYNISTKVGKTHAPGRYGEDSFDYSRQAILRSLDDSRSRTGVDYFDIVHLHDIEYRGRVNVEWALDEGYETLEQLRQDGRIGAVGFGIYPMDLWRRIVDEVRIDAMLTHNHYCLVDTRLVQLLPKIIDKGIALINASPFGSGLLSGREPPEWHPAEESDRKHLAEAMRFCESQNVPIAKLALQFSASNPDIPTTMFSSASADSVNRNVRWLEDEYEGELIERVRDILAPASDKEWDYDAGVDRLKKS
jgi:aryl-alcohol dehydrogenase-like predicted oxidoreductase